MDNRNLGTFINGLEILSKYYDKELKAFDFCTAEHDQIYFFVYNDLSEEDEKLLDLFGFHRDENNGWSYYT